MVRIILFLFLVGCQVYNSADRDKLLYGSGVDPDSTFGRAFTVITTRCISCHPKFGSWKTQDAWVRNGYVVGGSLTGSQLYYRLYGVNLGVGAEDMPLNSALTPQELADIRDWISSVPP